MKANVISWAILCMVVIGLMCFWFLKSNTTGVCFCGFLLLYTQQWWIADMREEGDE